MRAIKPLLSLHVLKEIYYSHFHAIISYGLMFWGNSAHSVKVFRMQKKIIRIMTGSRSRESCRKWFKHYNILTLPSLYILSILRFVIKNKETFITNNEIHEHDTRQVNNLHFPLATLKKFQSGAYYMGIKIYNNLPDYIKQEFNNKIKFESLLKQFLHQKTYYSIDEFLNSM
jgi:hypothetical protein